MNRKRIYNHRRDAQREIYENVKQDEKEWRKHSQRITERMAEELRLPSDVVAGNPIVHMFGANKLLVINYKKLTEYQADTIRILTGIGCVQILGVNMRIVFYTRDEIKIVGIIKKVEVIS